MNNWKIESGIPMPSTSGRGASPKYPFGDMQVGDSVFFEGCDTKSNCVVAAHVFGSSRNIKFSARTLDGGVRIWRIA